MRTELANALSLARDLPASELPFLLGDLEVIRTIALARLASPPVATEDRMLDVEETAARLHCSPQYLYRHHRKLPFSRQDKIGRKLLFSSAGLDSYLRKSR
jgi:hypothetical protein